mmetsp:Transcript_402/g.523  ORF Transcript_402/g.523 Transcript_402/m.523 type:complete len:506 (+) Transcript_402:152-1669(+)
MSNLSILATRRVRLLLARKRICCVNHGRRILVRCHNSGALFSLDDSASRITALGAVMNCVLGCAKFGVGTMCTSPALIADGVHSFSDLATDIISVATFKLARVPADDDHTWGHGKLEALGTIAVGGALVTLAGGIALHSSAVLLSLAGLEEQAIFLFGWGENSSSIDDTINIIATPNQVHSFVAGITAFGSILAKEWLFRETRRVGKESGSSVIVANAYHHRSDALSSVASLIGIGLAACIHPACDPAAGLLVAVAIGKAGLDVSKQAMDELLDAIDPKLVRILKTAVDTPGVRLTAVRARTTGGLLLVDADLAVASTSNSTLTASAAFHMSQHAAKKMRDTARSSGYIVHDIRLTMDPRPTAWLHDSTQVGDPYAVPPVYSLPSPHDLEIQVCKAISHFRSLHNTEEPPHSCKKKYPYFLGLNDLILSYAAPHDSVITAKLDIQIDFVLLSSSYSDISPQDKLISLATSLRRHIQLHVPLLSRIDISCSLLNSATEDKIHYTHV